MYNKVTSSVIAELKKICGNSYVYVDSDILIANGSDETEDICIHPEVVVEPSCADEISKIIILANKHIVPVTPRGAGTGLSGGAIPAFGGIVIKTNRLNKIIEIDERNLQATVEPGVINEVFRNAVEEKGLFYPPDPASKGSCFLGGNLAESSGGPKAVKYGTTKDYVLNLEIVLPTGEIIQTGANVLKNATGYNLTQLMIGSEGTLGIITKIVFRLIPLPKYTLLMLAPFQSPENACKCVSEIFKKGYTPSAMEFMERDAIEWAMKYTGESVVPLDSTTMAHLLIELDGNNIEQLYSDSEEINKILESFECNQVFLADTEEQKNNLWKLRRKVGEAVKAHSVYKEEDTVVPRADLATLLAGVKNIGKKYGFQSVCYGHAGDGNLHVNIIKGELSEDQWNTELENGIREIFELCKKLNGTISGEHGIGLVQKKYISIPFSEKMISIQKEIKKTFDPNLILNPGKIFP